MNAPPIERLGELELTAASDEAHLELYELIADEAANLTVPAPAEEQAETVEEAA